MQCVACNEDFSTEVDACPHCLKSDSAQIAPTEFALTDEMQLTEAGSSAMTDNSNATPQTTQSAPNTTLLEFPGANRRPAWRKELSERFREIQQKRAREATNESGDVFGDEPQQTGTGFFDSASDAKSSDTSKQLGLVPPPPEGPEMNPIVVAALRRIERARISSSATHAASSGRGQTATAAARVVEEVTEQFEETAAPPAPSKRQSQRAEKPDSGNEQARASTLVVVPPKPNAKPEPTSPVLNSAPAFKTTVTTTPPAVETPTTPPIVESAAAESKVAQSQTSSGKPQPRHIAGVIDEFWLERQGIELLPKVAALDASHDDRAPRLKRLAAGIIDLVAVAFLSAPFAALIELSVSNWSDPRVSSSMAGIVAVVIFLYNTCSVALAGRTLGMSLCSLHVVDAKTASVPTTGQCMRRAFVYMLSLATLGIGILYSLFDAEGRTAHDLLSGTIVVNK